MEFEQTKTTKTNTTNKPKKNETAVFLETDFSNEGLDFLNKQGMKLGLNASKLSPMEVKTIEHIYKSKKIDVVIEKSKDKYSDDIAYFYSERDDIYKLFDENNFVGELIRIGFRRAEAVKLFKEIWVNRFRKFDLLKELTERERKVYSKKMTFIDNSIQFKNKIIVYSKKHSKLQVINRNKDNPNKYPSINKMPYNIDLEKHTLNPIIEEYFMNIAGGDKKIKEFYLDVMATIFLPNNIVGRMFWFYGEGGLGKSEMMSWISRILGDHNVSSVEMDEWNVNNSNRGFKLHQIESKLLNIDDDYSKNMMKNTGRLKSAITSVNSATYDVKNHQPIAFKAKCKFFVGTNAIPVFHSADSGDLRRNIVIPFRAKFGKEYDFNKLDTFEIYENMINEMVKRAEIMANGKPHNKGVLEGRIPEEVRKMTSSIVDLKTLILNFLYGEWNTIHEHIEANDYETNDFIFKKGQDKNTSFYIDMSVFVGQFNKYLKEIGEVDSKNKGNYDIKTIKKEFEKQDWTYLQQFKPQDVNGKTRRVIKIKYGNLFDCIEEVKLREEEVGSK